MRLSYVDDARRGADALLRLQAIARRASHRRDSTHRSSAKTHGIVVALSAFKVPGIELNERQPRKLLVCVVGDRRIGGRVDVGDEHISDVGERRPQAAIFLEARGDDVGDVARNIGAQRP
jgi:hypothetical protein